MVDMSPQPLMPVVSRQYNPRSKLWTLGFLHPKWRRVWRIGYTGWHEEEVVEPVVGSERTFYEQELTMWMSYALELRDLLRGQNKRLYEAARERDQLLGESRRRREASERAARCVAAFEAAHPEDSWDGLPECYYEPRSDDNA